MSHYYTSNLDTKSNIKSIEVTLRGESFIFYTDHGVFSKETVDYGSRVLIESYQYKEHHQRILDVGCGYGPIGISLAKKFSDLSVDMIDVNLRAIELCQRNIEENRVTNARAFYSDLYTEVQGPYDCILTNPPIRAGKPVVHRILEESIDYLAENGELWVVIRKKHGAPSAKKKMFEVFGNCDIMTRDSGYYILKSVKKNQLSLK